MRWRKTVRIKDLLGPDGSPETVRTACDRLAARFKSMRADDMDLDDLMVDFEDLGREDGASCGDFNGLLDQLYDWANANRIWLG